MNINRKAESLALNLYLIRKKNGLTQKEMAKRIGIGINTLRQLEKGIIPSRVSVGLIFNISNEFNIEPYELFIIEQE